MTKPCLKWAGGKRRLLPELLETVKSTGWKADYPRGSYLEPFFGGGALFFALYNEGLLLSSKDIANDVLGDANPRLMRTYRAIETKLPAVKAILETFAIDHSEDFYYKLRSFDIDARSDEFLAAWMLYMNKAGFNGLYRVNNDGKLNVPFGKKERIEFDYENLSNVSKAFRQAELYTGDFMKVFKLAREGDLVYCDPPYIPLTASCSFTTYTQDGFTDADQIRLRDTAKAALRRGVHVVLSNSSAPRVRELYTDDVFLVKEVSVRHNVGAKATSRGHVTESIIMGVRS